MADARLKEAAKLGFKAAYAPADSKIAVLGLSLVPLRTSAELLARIRKP
jgi:predicted ATP-dependent serine protease